MLTAGHAAKYLKYLVEWYNEGSVKDYAYIVQVVKDRLLPLFPLLPADHAHLDLLHRSLMTDEPCMHALYIHDKCIPNVVIRHHFPFRGSRRSSIGLIVSLDAISGKASLQGIQCLWSKTTGSLFISKRVSMIRHFFSHFLVARFWLWSCHINIELCGKRRLLFSRKRTHVDDNCRNILPVRLHFIAANAGKSVFYYYF